MPLLSDLALRLMLLLGSKTTPLPAAPTLVDALQSVEVTADREKGDGVQVVFRQWPPASLLGDPSLAPGNRLIVAVLVGLVPHVLLDGIIAHQESGDGTLTVTARDLSAELDLEERDARYPNQSDSVIVAQILGRYANLGITPAVSPTADVPIETERVPQQNETDLAFVRRMAERNGYVFYIEPVTIGVSKAYWGPEVRAGIPQPALTQGMGAAANVSSISFAIDAEAGVETSGRILEPFTGLALPVPSLPSLRVPPLAARPVPAMRRAIARDTANQSAATAATSVLAASANAPNAVTGTGEVDTAAYGHVLRPRGLVGVRGVGLAFDGLYVVDAVTHKLSRGAYTQSFRLSREGLVSTVPVVPV
jgi:hypothetical protein